MRPIVKLVMALTFELLMDQVKTKGWAKKKYLSYMRTYNSFWIFFNCSVNADFEYDLDFMYSQQLL